MNLIRIDFLSLSVNPLAGVRIKHNSFLNLENEIIFVIQIRARSVGKDLNRFRLHSLRVKPAVTFRFSRDAEVRNKRSRFLITISILFGEKRALFLSLDPFIALAVKVPTMLS